MSFAYRVSGTFLMDTGQHQPVQTEALLGCTIVRALRNPGDRSRIVAFGEEMIYNFKGAFGVFTI
jgi:hypothetical protein